MDPIIFSIFESILISFFIIVLCFGFAEYTITDFLSDTYRVIRITKVNGDIKYKIKTKYYIFWFYITDKDGKPLIFGNESEIERFIESKSLKIKNKEVEKVEELPIQTIKF